ncbi:MAG: CDP-alcohol phosphatidyltransferase family protein [Planctomycetes bacterium]|nr:CDP-alcohol phosphatidyltransferase family protein [Planctomycetota bacterium]
MMRLSLATRITLLRILLIVPFICCLLKTNSQDLALSTRVLLRHLALGIFVVMAVSDALDGYMARRLKDITQLGTFLDPVADKLLMTSACLLLTSQRAHVPGYLIPPTVVVLIIGKDLLLSIGFGILYVLTSDAVVRPNFFGKASTMLQLLMVGAVLLGPEASDLLPRWGQFARVLWWSAATSAVLAALVYIRDGSRYIEAHERATGRA